MSDASLSPVSSRTEKGQRGFALDLHVTFRTPLPRAEALAALRALEGLTVDLYARLDTPGEVPSARLTGPLPQLPELHAALRGWLAGPVRVVEVGQRGYLRSAQGYTEWMPWRRNVILPRERVDEVGLLEGEKYILE
ncbi:hypothetical protein GCM10017783_18390 [Deinococcus piscis]|uniref:Uncharacterized protein n=1 Tax=Deinococcus piscis TaxID=394230 RepID=A0ABQ3K6R6_9DEIO|nr:hypothetical protein [Deinococcus piscis]GHG06121.1 hypothetical protein GCM10017783_18390 [Deinococcus piscis]